VIELLQSSRTSPEQFMVEFMQVANRRADVSIHSVTGESGRLVLRARSGSADSAANFSAWLGRSRQFSDVNLRQFYVDNGPARPSYEFDLDCAYLPGRGAGSNPQSRAPAGKAAPARPRGGFLIDRPAKIQAIVLIAAALALAPAIYLLAVSERHTGEWKARMRKGLNYLRAPMEGVIMIAAAALGAVVYFFGVPGAFESNSSLFAGIDRLHKQSLRLKSQNDQNEAFRHQLATYQERIRQLEIQMKVLGAIVPDEPKSPQIKSMIDVAGTATGVQVRSVEAQKQALHGDYVELPFTVRIVGRYDSLLRFFRHLRQERRIVNISNPSLGPPEHSRGDFGIRPNELVAAQCVVTAYYMRLKA